MAYTAADLATPRFARMIGSLRGFGFQFTVGEFVEFLDQQDAERQEWIASASMFEVLDWLAEQMR